MQKKTTKRLKNSLSILLLVILIGCLLVGCAPSRQVKKQPTYLFIGDSIAEALLGPSPISERDSYGYYSIVGQINDAKYVNRAISGLTSIGFVNSLCNRRFYAEEDAFYREYWIKNADIVFISMLGNDVLCSDMIDFAIDTGKATTAAGKITLSADYQSKLDRRCKPNVQEAMARIYEINPDVTVVWQTLYNPFYNDSVLIDQEDWDRYNEEIGKGTIDEKYSFRGLADILVNAMNDIVYDYQRNNPDKKFIISDVKSAFDAVFAQGDQEGAKLIFSDCIHPSVRGHALIAETLEKTLCEMGQSDMSSAVGRYKNVVADRMQRLYSDVSSDAVLSADTFAGVTNAYFSSTEGTLPRCEANATPTSGTFFEEEGYYELSSLKLDDVELSSLHLDEMEMELDENLEKLINKMYPNGIQVLNTMESSLVFENNGEFTLTLMLDDSFVSAVNSILSLGLFDISDFDAVNFYKNVPFCDYNTTYEMYFSELFPGFDITDLKKSVETLSIVGCSLTGVDTESESFAAVAASLKDNGTLPADFRLPNGFGIRLKGYYSLETLGEGAAARKVAYLRLVRTGDNTVPMFCVLLDGNDDEGSALMKIEFCSIRILFKLA